MKRKGDVFDFTSAHGAAGGQDALVRIDTAARLLTIQLGADSRLGAETPKQLAALDVLLAEIHASMPGALGGVSSEPDRAAWLELVLDRLRNTIPLLEHALEDAHSAALAEGLAKLACECVRWELVAKRVPDVDVWRVLGHGFATGGDSSLVRIDERYGGVAKEYLRAIAYHSAGVDLLTIEQAAAVCRLVDLLLPRLTLNRGAGAFILYVVDPPQSPVPVRLSRASGMASGWGFSPGDAIEVLAETHGQLLRGDVPSGLTGWEPGTLRDAAAHLRRLWSHRPPVRRFRRHGADGKLLVVKGYGDIKALFQAKSGLEFRGWRIADLSRGGVGALLMPKDGGPVPDHGALLAFRPHDGVNWHLGLVRRVRLAKECAEVGIETLSIRPELVRVDDGRVPSEMLFCDPVLKGEAVRVVAGVGAFREGASLFVNVEGRLSKLKPLGGMLQGEDYELRVFQVV